MTVLYFHFDHARAWMPLLTRLQFLQWICTQFFEPTRGCGYMLRCTLIADGRLTEQRVLPNVLVTPDPLWKIETVLEKEVFFGGLHRQWIFHLAKYKYMWLFIFCFDGTSFFLFRVCAPTTTIQLLGCLARNPARADLVKEQILGQSMLSRWHSLTPIDFVHYGK